jgi:hypothetical protein
VTRGGGQEEVRPIYWANRPRSYLSRTLHWDDFPNGAPPLPPLAPLPAPRSPPLAPAPRPSSWLMPCPAACETVRGTA